MRDRSKIPSRCGECRFFARNTCYFNGCGHSHYGVNAYTPVCWDILTLQGGYTNEELWNEEIRTKRECGYDKD